MLIKCPECKKEISDQAVQCIHCGFPLLQSRAIDNANANVGKRYSIFLMPLTDKQISKRDINRLISEFSPSYSMMEIEYMFSTKGRALLKSNLDYDAAKCIQSKFKELHAEIAIGEMSNKVEIRSGKISPTPPVQNAAPPPSLPVLAVSISHGD